MSQADRDRWEKRHQRPMIAEPYESVCALRPRRNKETALDLACGQGRHSRALLEAGFWVVAVDVSATALAHLEVIAPSFSGRLLPVQADLDHWPFAADCFDLVVQCDFLDRALLPAVRDTLKPGGVLLLDTFLHGSQPNRNGPSNPDYLLKAGELLSLFENWQILDLQESSGEDCRGRILARKP